MKGMAAFIMVVNSLSVDFVIVILYLEFCTANVLDILIYYYC